MIALSRLEKFELRDIWRTEIQSFTHWLAQEENTSLLANKLGLDDETRWPEYCPWMISSLAVDRVIRPRVKTLDPSHFPAPGEGSTDD